MRKVKDYFAILGCYGYRLMCGGEEDSWVVMKQQIAGAVEEVAEGLEIGVSLEKTVQCWLQWIRTSVE